MDIYTTSELFIFKSIFNKLFLIVTFVYPQNFSLKQTFSNPQNFISSKTLPYRVYLDCIIYEHIIWYFTLAADNEMLLRLLLSLASVNST